MPAAQNPKRPNRPLLTVRTALIILLASLSAIAADVLTVQAGYSTAQATLAAAGSLIASLKFFDWLIG